MIILNRENCISVINGSRLPFEEYERDQVRLPEIIARLVTKCDIREKLIQRIIELRSIVESEKAHRMFPTLTLQKWKAALESFQAEQLKNTKS